MSHRDVRGFLEDALGDAFEVSLAWIMMTPRLFAVLHVVVELVDAWQHAAAALATMTLSPRWGPRLAWQAQATPRVDVAEVSFASSGLMGSDTKKMKAPSPAFPEFIDSDADPEFQIFVVLFSGRSRCVMVRASWAVQKLVEVVAEVSEVPA